MTWSGMRSLAYRGSGRSERLHASGARGHIIARRCWGVVLSLRSSLGSAPRRNTRTGSERRAIARATRGEDTPNYAALRGPWIVTRCGFRLHDMGREGMMSHHRSPIINHRSSVIDHGNGSPTASEPARPRA